MEAMQEYDKRINCLLARLVSLYLLSLPAMCHDEPVCAFR